MRGLEHFSFTLSDNSYLKIFSIRRKEGKFHKDFKLPFEKRDFCFHIDAAVANVYFDLVDKTWLFPIRQG